MFIGQDLIWLTFQDGKYIWDCGGYHRHINETRNGCSKLLFLTSLKSASWNSVTAKMSIGRYGASAAIIVTQNNFSEAIAPLDSGYEGKSRVQIINKALNAIKQELLEVLIIATLPLHTLPHSAMTLCISHTQCMMLATLPLCIIQAKTQMHDMKFF